MRFHLIIITGLCTKPERRLRRKTNVGQRDKKKNRGRRKKKKEEKKKRRQRRKEMGRIRDRRDRDKSERNRAADVRRERTELPSFISTY